MGRLLLITSLSFLLCGVAEAADHIGVTNISASSPGVVGPPPSSDETWYVDAQFGSDTNPGTQSEPFKTIQKAASIVTPGSTVIVKDGAYTDTDDDNFVVDLNKGGTSSNWITFKSENKWGAVLDGQNNQVGYCWNFGTNANYVTVQGFELKGCAWGGFWSNADAHDVYIFGNHIHHMGRRCTDTALGNGLAVYQGSSTSHHTYDSNVIHDNGRYQDGENGCQNGNTYWQNHDHAFYINENNGPNLILNNIFYNHKSGWMVILSRGTDNTKLFNNIFVDKNPNRDGHIKLSGESDGSGDGSNDNILIQNNIFYEPRDFVVACYNSQNGSVTVESNLIFPNSIGIISSSCSSVVFSVSNNHYGNPSFIDYDNRDFHLSSNSPAIDAGLTIPEVTADIDGIARPQGPSYDIGAYEYIDGSPTDWIFTDDFESGDTGDWSTRFPAPPN